MIHFDDLAIASLLVDEVYEGGVAGNAGDDPLSKLLGVGVQGGIRKKKSNLAGQLSYVTLSLSNFNVNWPDYYNVESGILKYYGDNRISGKELHDTKAGGNLFFKNVFEAANTKAGREKMPPIFAFEKFSTNSVSSNRCIRFIGLVVPGTVIQSNYSIDEALSAVWRTDENGRFQNYEAYFSILNINKVSRQWIEALKTDFGNHFRHAPKEWKKYVENGLTDSLVLKAPIEKKIRGPKEQLPDENTIESDILKTVYDNFKDNPTDFEKFATEIVKLMDSNFTSFDITRPWRDGGRDAIGEYSIGPKFDNMRNLKLVCSLEAKCYNATSGNGVKQMSRLISRLKYREFGIFITTSYVDSQAYKEVVEDGHPILILSGKDIAQILINKHINTKEKVVGFINQVMQ